MPPTEELSKQPENNQSRVIGLIAWEGTGSWSGGKWSTAGFAPLLFVAILLGEANLPRLSHICDS